MHRRHRLASPATTRRSLVRTARPEQPGGVRYPPQTWRWSGDDPGLTGTVSSVIQRE